MKKYFMRFSLACSDTNVFNALMSILTVSAVCLAVTLCAAQVGLRIFPLRNYLTNADTLDGAVLAGTQPVINHGTVTLRLDEGTPSDDIRVVVNGDDTMPFDDFECTVEVAVQSVIEVRNLSGKTIAVSVVGVSDNLDAVLNNESAVIEKSAVLCRVLFND